MVPARCVATPAETVMKPAPGISLPSSSAMSRSQHERAPRRRRGGHEDGELVGPRAPDHVGHAREGAQALGHGQERRVAGRWAAAGVERAEVVDVDERQRGGLLGARGVGEDRLGVAAERLEGQQPGAGVGTGAVGQLGLEAREPGAGIGQRAAQLLTIAPQQHDRVIGRL